MYLVQVVRPGQGIEAPANQWRGGCSTSKYMFLLLRLLAEWWQNRVKNGLVLIKKVPSRVFYNTPLYFVSRSSSASVADHSLFRTFSFVVFACSAVQDLCPESTSKSELSLSAHLVDCPSFPAAHEFVSATVPDDVSHSVSVWSNGMLKSTSLLCTSIWIPENVTILDGGD